MSLLTPEREFRFIVCYFPKYYIILVIAATQVVTIVIELSASKLRSAAYLVVILPLHFLTITH